MHSSSWTFIAASLVPQSSNGERRRKGRRSRVTSWPLGAPERSADRRLRAGAGTSGHRLVPATQGAEAVADRHLGRRGRKIDGHKGRVDSRRDAGSSDERHLLEVGVEVPIEVGGAALAAFDQLGNLLMVVRTR